jgi:hypothetical protein
MGGKVAILTDTYLALLGIDERSCLKFPGADPGKEVGINEH